MDKIDRLLDVIEHPDRYSEKEVETMLSDPEVRELYGLLDKTKASLAPIPTPDIDAEWESFKSLHPKTHKREGLRILNIFSRNVAASIAIGIASLAAVAAVVGVSVNYALNYKKDSSTQEIAQIEPTAVIPSDTIVVVEDMRVTAPEIIIFDNEPLGTIVNDIAEYYGCKAEFSTEASRMLRLYFRWNQSHTLDEVAESLNNFEQIHITVKDDTIKID